KLELLKRISNQQVGIIELDASLDIDEVTEIFIRINQKGVKLSNADFVMSKIAADEEHQGNKMRRMIDYFCRLVVDKSFHKHIVDNDPEFVLILITIRLNGWLQVKIICMSLIIQTCYV